MPNRPCLSGELPGYQVLSLCSEKETKDLMREVGRQEFLHRLMLPDDILPRIRAAETTLSTPRGTFDLVAKPRAG